MLKIIKVEEASLCIEYSLISSEDVLKVWDLQNIVLRRTFHRSLSVVGFITPTTGNK